MAIALPKNPSGEQYEDLIAAALSVGGHFVEAQLKLRDSGKELLELDLVASPVGGGIEDRRLYEVKKQRFAFNNLFKLFGQRTFLQIPAASLVSSDGCDARVLAVYEQRAEEMGITLHHVNADPDEVPKLGPPPNNLDEPKWRLMSSVAWYGCIGRREALAALRAMARANQGSFEFDACRKYEFNTRASFFLGTPLERAEALYKAYFDSPRLSQDIVRFEAGRLGRVEEDVWNEARDTHGHLGVQGIMDLESKARLSIVKNALDDFLKRGTAPPPTTTLKVGSLSLEVPEHGLPSSFNDGVKELARHRHATRLPYLFQAFYLVFGGFVSLEGNEDLELLEELSGVPAGEIVDALHLLSVFFGAGKSFFFCPRDALLCLKMVPGVVRGGGAFMRQAVFGFGDYTDKYPKMGWLMAKWHNALYHALVPALGR